MSEPTHLPLVTSKQREVHSRMVEVLRANHFEQITWGSDEEIWQLAGEGTFPHQRVKLRLVENVHDPVIAEVYVAQEMAWNAKALWMALDRLTVTA